MDNDTLGNLTTIIKILIMTVAPAIAVYLGTDEQVVATFLTAVLTFLLAVLDARYPNNLKVFDDNTITHNEALNDEYESEADDQ